MRQERDDFRYSAKKSVYRRMKRRKAIRNRLILGMTVSLTVLVLVGLCVNTLKNKPYPKDTIFASEGGNANQESGNTVSGTEEQAKRGTEEESEGVSAGTEAKTEEITGKESSAGSYDFTKPVPEGDMVDESYFADAVFIGDSRTEGFINTSGLSNTTAYAHKGLMVDTVFTSPVIDQGGSKMPVMDALTETSFNKVYIMLGVNETGWPYENIFIDKYKLVIEKIKQINPNAYIYIQSILPVSNSVSSTHSYVKNDKISRYNELLQAMAEEAGVYYLNVAEAVAGADGALPDEAAVDGIHLKKDYCIKWLEYLEKHTVR